MPRWPPVLLLALALPALAAPPEIPPAERAAKLRRAWAGEHADLGVFAAGGQLLVEAETHFLLAIRLDPECRTARMRLGHRRGADGKWAPGPPKEWRTAEEAEEGGRR